MRSIVMQRVFNPGPKLGAGAGVIGMRTHDLSGSDFEGYLRMPRRFAEGLTEGIPNLHWRYQTPPETTSVQPMHAKIGLREDPGLDKRNFVLLAHKVGHDRLYTVGYLDKEQADELVRELDIPYVGPPEAEYVSIMTRLKVADLRARADALEASLQDPSAGTAPDVATDTAAGESHDDEGWSDLKVAFDADDTDAVWNAPADAWPDGWALNESDGSGARNVVIFRVDHLPTSDETRAVAAGIGKLDQSITPEI